MAKKRKLIEFTYKRELDGTTHGSLSLNYETSEAERENALKGLMRATLTAATNWNMTDKLEVLRLAIAEKHD